MIVQKVEMFLIYGECHRITREAVRVYGEKFPDRNRPSRFRLCNVLDYVSMFKVDILNISSENVNMFEECFEIIRFLFQLTLNDLE